MFKIKHIDDESFDIFVNGIFITNVNHDEHGWSGIDTIRALIVSIAYELDMDVTEESYD